MVCNLISNITIVMEIAIIAVLLVAAGMDIKSRIIPVWIPVACASVSAITAIIQYMQGTASFGSLALSLAPGALFILLAYATHEGIGLGDGLILLCIGPAFGLGSLCLGVLASLTLTSIVSIALLVTGKGGRGTRIPFIPFLTAGMGVALFV